MPLWKRKYKKNKQRIPSENIPHKTFNPKKRKEINERLEDTIDFLKEVLGENDDFLIRKFSIFGKFKAAIFYLSPIVDETVVSEELLKPLMTNHKHLAKEEISSKRLINVLQEEVIYHSEARLETNLTTLVAKLLGGETVIAIDGVKQAFHIDTRKVEKRAITQPETEQVIIGPREGFIEQLSANIGLLRYRLQTPDIRIKMLTVGRLTKSKVAVCYLKGTANPALIDEVERRLSNIQIDAIIDAGYLEQFIEDHYLSPFPQVQLTERPDRVVGNLIEGRVAVLVDGSPFALIVPVVFNQFYSTIDDYTSRFLMGSFVRLVRLLALVFSLIFPSIYVSFISFNPELLPTQFAVAVSSGRAGVPFPAVVEVLIIEVFMEILREATVRLPQQVGGALSIVGILVIGQAAVEAGISSPVTVVVIAITTIGSFATPVYAASFALRMLRFPMVILAGIFGLYGVMIGILVILNHMLSLKSFGVPYMSPVSPANKEGMKDVVIRSPLWWMPKRPSFLHTKNDDRLGSNDKLLKTAPKNTLGETKVGNDRWEDEEDGAST